MDLILCRNVLMYFVAPRAQQVRHRFFNALVAGGWLVVAASELSQANFAQFTVVRFPGAFAYQRAATPPRAVPRLESLAPLPVPASARPPAPPAGVPVSQLAARVRDLAGQGQLSEALLVCDQALAAGRLDPALHYLHAIILQEQKRDAEAALALKHALYLDPNFVLAHIALGGLARRRGHALVAQKSFQIALELLEASGPDDILPEAEGLTASRLR